MGRSWSSNPWYWSQADSKLFGTKVRRLMMTLALNIANCGFWLTRLSPPLWLMVRSVLELQHLRAVVVFVSVEVFAGLKEGRCEKATALAQALTVNQPSISSMKAKVWCYIPVDETNTRASPTSFVSEACVKAAVPIVVLNTRSNPRPSMFVFCWRRPRQDPGLTRREVLERYAEYGERQEKTYGDNWLVCRRRLAKPIWHLFHGEKGGKKFR